jgi:mono/diheme cytochrome c family protein
MYRKRNRGDGMVITNPDERESNVNCFCLARGRGGFWRTVIAVFAAAGTVALFADANRVWGQSKDTPAKSAATPAGNVETGKQLFKKSGCYECHGTQGQIASRAGPALTPALAPFDGFTAYIRRPSGSMPGYTEKVLSNQELADIYAFLRTVPRPLPSKEIPLLNPVGDSAAGKH